MSLLQTVISRVVIQKRIHKENNTEFLLRIRQPASLDCDEVLVVRRLRVSQLH
jgi:hypothetical protein